MGFPIGDELKIDGSGELDPPDREEHDFVAPVRLGIGRWSRWVAVAGGFGYVPLAPGTAGSFAGLLLFGAIGIAGSSPSGFLALYTFAVASLLLLGVRAAGRAEVDFGRRDDGRIVIDEVVGQLFGLLPVAILWAPWMPIDAWPIAANEDALLLFSEVVTGFVLFRLFDVWKPGAVRWAERRFEGGVGVMADDLVAGAYTALGLLLLHLLVLERFVSSGASRAAVAGGFGGLGGPLGGPA